MKMNAKWRTLGFRHLLLDARGWFDEDLTVMLYVVHHSDPYQPTSIKGIYNCSRFGNRSCDGIA